MNSKRSLDEMQSGIVFQIEALLRANKIKTQAPKRIFSQNYPKRRTSASAR
jgi:hypothetical protein